MSELLPVGRRPSTRARTPQGFFGAYGGRFVPETVIPALEELTAAYEAACDDPAFEAELDDLLARLRRPRHAALPRRAARRGGRARHRLPQARGPVPHRRAQDQQHARPVPARQAHGQEARHRRDGRRPARRRDRDGRRAHGPRVRRLHGRRGHPPPVAQRLQDAAARRRGHPGRRGDAARWPTRSPRRCATGSSASRTRSTCSARAVGPHPYPMMVRDFQSVIGREIIEQLQARGRRAASTRSSRASAAAPTRSARSTRSCSASDALGSARCSSAPRPRAWDSTPTRPARR